MTHTPAKTIVPAERPVALPDYQPQERFWPYVELTEEPTPEELAALDPDLRAALYGPADIPFSFTLVFPRFEGPDYERAVEMARQSAEYREVGTGDEVPRARALLSGRRRHACATCSRWPVDTRAAKCWWTIAPCPSRASSGCR